MIISVLQILQYFFVLYSVTVLNFMSLQLTNSITQESNTALVYRCDLCDCTCTSMKQLLEHKAGAKHKQIARFVKISR